MAEYQAKPILPAYPPAKSQKGGEVMGEQMTLEQIMAEFEEGLRVCEAEIEKVQKARDGARANVKTLGRELAGLGKRRTSLLHALGRVDEGRRKRVKKP